MIEKLQIARYLSIQEKVNCHLESEEMFKRDTAKLNRFLYKKSAQFEKRTMG